MFLGKSLERHGCGIEMLLHQRTTASVYLQRTIYTMYGKPTLFGMQEASSTEKITATDFDVTKEITIVESVKCVCTYEPNGMDEGR